MSSVVLNIYITSYIWLCALYAGIPSLDQVSINPHSFSAEDYMDSSETTSNTEGHSGSRIPVTSSPKLSGAKTNKSSKSKQQKYELYNFWYLHSLWTSLRWFNLLKIGIENTALLQLLCAILCSKLVILHAVVWYLSCAVTYYHRIGGHLDKLYGVFLPFWAQLTQAELVEFELSEEKQLRKACQDRLYRGVLSTWAFCTSTLDLHACVKCRMVRLGNVVRGMFAKSVGNLQP